uniref:Copine C-terminal domain-containing protein n=1 Tax=Ditylenchus dipsaci TaxID=166011 RepID=A0A915EI09_9BILA
MEEGHDNQYQTAIKSVLEKWFVENKPYAPYQAYGEEQWYVYGEQGVLQAYATAIHQVKLSGDTNFAPTINAFASKTRAFYTGNPNRDYKYQILLIITDGIITDMSETKKAILEASKLPLSIIIVGVGDADFSAMKELDGDDKTLEYNGEKAKRDIVQILLFLLTLELEALAMRAEDHHGT